LAHLPGRADGAKLKRWARVRNRLKVEIHVEHLQPFDQDNLYSCAKLPLDALVRMDFLADDSPEFIDLTVTQSRSKAKQTTISIYAPKVVKPCGS
jgi:Holliday junction resolvase RusA-like endonuclease